jgi:hypothetical protein
LAVFGVPLAHETTVCFSLALSLDGRNLYLGSCGDLTIVSRNADDGLTQTGCIDASGRPATPAPVTPERRPQTSIALSPDGKNFYLRLTQTGVG